MSKNWGQEITALINKKSADIEDPLRRFKFFKLLACAAKHEALQTLEPFLPDKYLRGLDMNITATQMLDYTEESDGTD
jgi:hypothetical protein